jgi:hypothetical protein
MRKLVITLALLNLAFLASSFFAVHAVEAAYTPDGAGFPLCSGIDINSPTNSTCYSSVLTLSVSVRGLLSPQFYTYTLVYNLDGISNVTVPVESTFVPVMATTTYANGTIENIISQFFSYYLITGSVNLSKLAEGSHSLSVYGMYNRFNDQNTNWPKQILDKSTVDFTVDTRTAFNNMVGAHSMDSNNSASNPPVDSNSTTLASQPSQTSDTAHQPATGQTIISSILAASTIAGTISASIFFPAKRRRRNDICEPLSP